MFKIPEDDEEERGSRMDRLNEDFESHQSKEYDSDYDHEPNFLPIEWMFEEVYEGFVLDVSEMEGSGGGKYKLYIVVDGVGALINDDFPLDLEDHDILDKLKRVIGVYWS